MFILIDVLSWGAHTHTHAYIHVYCSPGTDLGYEVGGWCAVDGSRVLNKKKNQTKKKRPHILYSIQCSFCITRSVGSVTKAKPSCCDEPSSEAITLLLLFSLDVSLFLLLLLSIQEGEIQ